MQDVLRVLMIDDSEDDYWIVRRELERHDPSIVIQWVSSLDGLQEALGAGGWSIVLSDFNVLDLPFESIRAMIREHSTVLPIIVVSREIHEEVAVDVMRAGAKDCVLKDALKRLMPALLREVEDSKYRQAQLAIEQFVSRSADILKRIARGEPLYEVLNEICTLVDTLCPTTACAIFTMTPDGKCLESASAPALSEQYRETFKRFKIGPKACSCGTAAFTKQVVICEDIATDPLWEGYRDLPVPDLKIFRAAWSSPILDASDKVIGTYAQYFRESRAPTEKERSIVTRAMEMAAIAIQRHRYEAALRTSEAKLRAMADSTQLAMVMVDVKCENILFANRKMRALLAETSPDECPIVALHQHFGAFADSPTGFAEFKQQFLNGRLDRRSEEEEWNDGRFVRWSISSVKSESGELIGRVLVLDDITEYHTLEDRLRQASKLEAIGTLAGGIAHDFNNILTPIMGLATLGVGDEAEDPARRKRWQTVLDSSRRARDLVRKILSFSRRSEVMTQRINISALIEESLTLLAEALPSTIHLNLDFDDEAFYVEGDAASLEQVIMNLATNAFHAMEARGGTLKIALRDVPRLELPPGVRHASRARSFVLLTIEDSGVGIAEEDLTRVYDPFFTTKPVGKGTGLGLSQAIGIVHAHDGDMRVQSALGVGTTFSVYLPRADAAPATITPIEVPLTLSAEDAQILVVDDEVAIRELMVECLSSCGYHVDTAVDGMQAFDLMTRDPHKYHLLITDQTMPRMTGTELIRRLRKQGVRVPVMLCTGVIDARFSAELQHLGVNASLAKPISLDVLTAKVAEVVGAARPAST